MTCPGALCCLACGEANRITWLPEEHWAYRKATGLAYDFGLPEGTSVFAPAAGAAYFLRDERPLRPTWATMSIWWLRGAGWCAWRTCGTRRRGNARCGLASCSAIRAARAWRTRTFTLSLLIREGRRWVSPEAAQLTSLFGLPTADLVEGAILVNEGCAATLQTDGDAYLEGGSDLLALGQPRACRIPIRNVGIEAAAIEQVAVAARAGWGVAFRRGDGPLGAGWPNAARSGRRPEAR